MGPNPGQLCPSKQRWSGHRHTQRETSRGSGRRRRPHARERGPGGHRPPTPGARAAASRRGTVSVVQAAVLRRPQDTHRPETLARPWSPSPSRSSPRPRAGARLTLTLTHTGTYTQQRADAGQCPAGRAGSAEAALESAYLAGSPPGPVTWAVRRGPGGGSQSGHAWPDFCRQLWPPGPPHGRGRHHRGYFHGSPGPGNREGAGPQQLVL